MRLVYVHGIGGGPDRAEMERAWTEALAIGMTKAGHSEVSENLRKGVIVPEMVHYSPLYAVHGAQGGSFEEPLVDASLLEELLAEFIDDLSEMDPDPRDAAILVRAEEQLKPCGVAQGAGDAVRRVGNAVTTLLNLRLLRGIGRWTSARVMLGDFRQVTRYLDRGEMDEHGTTLDQRIRARFADVVGSGPAVVIAHSLGTVVALESLHGNDGVLVPMFVSLGSPLGMRTVVFPRILPQPPRTPDVVSRWLNFWDPDDVIVARRDLARDFSPNRDGVVAASDRVASVGLWTHSAVKYLTQPAVAGPIAEELRRIRVT